MEHPKIPNPLNWFCDVPWHQNQWAIGRYTALRRRGSDAALHSLLSGQGGPWREMTTVGNSATNLVIWSTKWWFNQQKWRFNGDEANILITRPMNMELWQTMRECRACGTKNPTEKENTSGSGVRQAAQTTQPSLLANIANNDVSSWIASGWGDKCLSISSTRKKCVVVGNDMAMVPTYVFFFFFRRYMSTIHPEPIQNLSSVQNQSLFQIL